MPSPLTTLLQVIDLSCTDLATLVALVHAVLSCVTLFVLLCEYMV